MEIWIYRTVTFLCSGLAFYYWLQIRRLSMRIIVLQHEKAGERARSDQIMMNLSLLQDD